MKIMQTLNVIGSTNYRLIDLSLV